MWGFITWFLFFWSIKQNCLTFHPSCSMCLSKELKSCVLYGHWCQSSHPLTFVSAYRTLESVTQRYRMRVITWPAVTHMKIDIWRRSLTFTRLCQSFHKIFILIILTSPSAAHLLVPGLLTSVLRNSMFKASTPQNEEANVSHFSWPSCSTAKAF